MTRWSLAILLAVLWPGVAAAQDCAERTSSGDVTLALEGAEARFSARDKAGVLAFSDDAQTAIPCLRDELGAALSARFHRVGGLRAFLEKDPERAKLWFAAARQVQPAFNLSESLVPEGHPLQSLYATAAAPVDVERLNTPAEGRMRFDGTDGTERPVKRPTLFQYVDGAGSVQVSALLDVGDPVPLEGIKLIKGSKAGGGAAAASGGRPARIALLTGSAVALATSAGSFIAAHGAQGRYNETKVNSANKAELDRLYRSNRTFTTISGVTAAVSVGLGVGAIFVGHW